MEDNLTKLARFFRLYGSRLIEGQRRNLRVKLADHGTERSGPVTKPPGELQASDVKETHFSELNKRERGAKLIKMAKKALRTDHIGTPDPKDVRKWLVEPKSRKYYGHSERFQADPEYAEQCRKNDTVDENGNLAQWVSEADGSWWYKDYEVVVNQENQQAAKGGGKSKPPASTRPQSAPIRWESRKNSRTAGSTQEASWDRSSSSSSHWKGSWWSG